MNSSAMMMTMTTIQSTVLKSKGTVAAAAVELAEVAPKLSVTVAVIE